MRSKKEITSFLYNNIEPKPDNKQIKIAMSRRKNILVVAAAGSGKTYVIVLRVLYLINILKVDPKKILCISFTNDAVDNLKKKLNNKDIDVLTFHKLSLKIIGKCKEILAEDMLSHIVLNSINNESLYALFKMDKKSLSNLIVTFINLFKSNNYELDDFYKMINKADYKDKLFLKEIMKCYICYETYLNKENIIDFNDMINLAIKKIDHCKLKYKYIIIDEYQDISYSKYILIRKIQEKNNSSIFAVGDDFQSIYRFAGSDIKLFTNFKKYFSFPKIFKLNKTYRNPNDVVKLSRNFIVKNPYQIRKKIKSNKQMDKSIQLIIYEDLNFIINSIIKEDGLDNILIIARNNYDIENIKIQKKINYKKMTVHKSKGLGYDYVFVINICNSYNGFPNKYKDHKILKYVNNYKAYYPYDEERRLFYVALTRCKKRVYLFAPKDNESIFINEIKRYKSVFIREK